MEFEIYPTLFIKLPDSQFLYFSHFINCMRDCDPSIYSEKLARVIKNKNYDFGAGCNAAIRYACEYGWTEIVKIILADGHVNLNENNDYSIRKAIERNHVEIVILLLKDKRIKYDKKCAVEYAYECKNFYMYYVLKYMQVFTMMTLCITAFIFVGALLE